MGSEMLVDSGLLGLLPSFSQPNTSHLIADNTTMAGGSLAEGKAFSLQIVLPAFLGVVVLGSFLFQILHELFLHPLRNVPGPFIAKFTDLWHLWRAWRGQFELDNVALHKKYGPIVRYGPNRYSIQDSGAIKTIYGNGHEFPKTNRYEAFGSPRYHEWTFLADRDLKRHSTNRRYINTMYSMSTVVKYEPYVDECSDVFFQKLREHSVNAAGHTDEVNMCRWFQCFAFDVISKMTYGKRIGFLDAGDDVGGVIAKLEDMVYHGTVVGIYPYLHHILFPLKNWWYGKRGTGRKYVVEFTKDIIRSRPDLHLPSLGEKSIDTKSEVTSAHAGNIDTATTEDGRAMDFLAKFWAKHLDNPEGFTEYHVLACCSANMFSGSDTTAITLCAILYYMLQNPETMRKLREEIADFNARGLLSEKIRFHQSLEMPYLQAVIKEALRIHPPLGLPIERWVPAGGATIAGQYFPEKTTVAVNGWVEHRDQSVFGPDADEFRPERWLIDDQDKVALMTRHWMPYGLGSRTCFGRNIAFMEISKLVPNLIRRFDFELCHPEKHWATRNRLFVKPKDFFVRIKTLEVEPARLVDA